MDVFRPLCDRGDGLGRRDEPGPRESAALAGWMNRALHAMLADRFQLKVRRETEQLPMYALTVATGGLESNLQRRTTARCMRRGMPRFQPSVDKPSCGAIRQTVPLAKLERLMAGEDHATVMALPGPDQD